MVNISAKTVARAVCGMTGAALAGPGGALIGNLAGGLLAVAIPGASPLLSAVVGNLGSKIIEKSTEAIKEHLTDPEKQRINHDLQTAFRDSFQQALFDLGGESCFPRVWKEKKRDVPPAMIYPLTPSAIRLWKTQDPLALQVCDCFNAMDRALKEEKLLPFDPPSDQLAASVMPYLESDDPKSLNETLFQQVVSPFLDNYKTLIAELPEFKTHLRKYLLDRMLVHLGEALKHRTPAWRAFNRMMLENLRGQAGDIKSGQEEIIQRLDDILAQPDQAPTWDGLTGGLADLLSATGRIEKKVDESFDALFIRVAAQHAEIIERFDLLMAASKRIESKVERVLHILEDGRYVIEGPALAAINEPPAPGEPPFMGLHYFDENDADLFFGREVLTSRLVERLNEISSPGSGKEEIRRRFLAVVGASGSGKSSLVRAGLIPALKRAPASEQGGPAWRVRIMTPTGQPLNALANAFIQDVPLPPQKLRDEFLADPLNLDRLLQDLPGLAAGGAQNWQLLLFVDQFEEIFTQCHDQNERQAFIDNLMAATQFSGRQEKRFTLIITLRADFYGHCGQYTDLREALERQQDYLGPMTTDELRSAIEEPAHRGGPDGVRWEFERGLVDLILRDLGNEPGALPLLSHALLETWKHRRGRTMTLESYAEAGGVRGAIAKTAETAYRHRFDLNQQRVARNIFLRLTELGEDAPDSRRRVSLDELIPPGKEAPAVKQVLKTLADARLITTSENTVEIAHEALIREWPTLRQWLDSDRTGLRLHRQLSEAAQEWAELGQDTGAVYRGLKLTQALEWAEENQDQLNAREREFLAYSQFVANRDAIEREEQRRRELEAAQRLAQEAEARRKAEQDRAQQAVQAASRLSTRNRIITIIGGVATLAAILACIFGLAAGLLGFQSNRNANRAEENLVTAQAANTRVASEANTRATAEAEALLQKATAEAANEEAQYQNKISLVREVSLRVSPVLERDQDLGLLLAIQAVDMANRLNNPSLIETQTTLYNALKTANYMRVLRGHTDMVYMATYSPNNDRLVTAGKDGTAYLWGTDGSFIAELKGHTDEVMSAIFSPDGKKIVTSSIDGTAIIWDADGKMIKKLEGHTAAVIWAIFSPDGSRIATASLDNTARIWKSDGELAAVLEGHNNAVALAIFSPNGKRVLTTSADATARLWNINGTLLATLQGHSQWINSACFSPDGSQIVTASFDGTARLWDGDGNPVSTFETHSAPLYTSVFSPDGKFIVTTADDGVVKLWKNNGSFVIEIKGHSGPVTMASFSPDSKKILTAGTDNMARLWRLDGSLIAVLRGHSSFISTALFRPDGQQILTASADGTARLWAADRLAINQFQAHNGPVVAASFDPNGNRIVTGGLDNLAKVWNLDGELISTLQGHLGGVTAVAYSPGGDTILTASRDTTAKLWRPDGTLITTFQGHEREVRAAAFSPDGKQVVTSDEAGVVRLWKTDGTPLLTIQASDAAVWAASISPDGAQILSAGDDQTAKLWGIDGQLITTFSGHTESVWAADFSPDGQTILTGSGDTTARLWSLDGKIIAEITGHTAPISVVKFSADGTMILTSSYDGTARLWSLDKNTMTVSFVAALEGHTDWVSAANFSPDGKKVVTGSWDSTIQLWNVYGDASAMLEDAKWRVGREMYDSECQEYLHVENCGSIP